MNQTKGLHEWFLMPKSLRPAELKSFLADSDRIGSFSFMCFMIAIISLIVYMVGVSLYEYWFALKARLIEEGASRAPPHLWISIYDYHTKLTPAQQEAYLEYSQRKFEEERMEIEKELASTVTATELSTEKIEELTALSKLSNWASRKVHFPHWTHREQKYITPESMV